MSSYDTSTSLLVVRPAYTALQSTLSVAPTGGPTPMGVGARGCPSRPRQLAPQTSTTDSVAISPLKHLNGLALGHTTPSIGPRVPIYAPHSGVPRAPSVGHPPVCSGHPPWTPLGRRAVEWSNLYPYGFPGKAAAQLQGRTDPYAQLLWSKPPML